MEPAITIIIAIVSSGALSTLITVIAQAIERKAKKKEAESRDNEDLKHGTRLVLYFQLKDHCNSAITDGDVEAYELEALMETHDVYKKLGGDGLCDHLMERVKALPITSR